MVLLIVLAVVGALAPVAVFVATATRLSAARREQRLAALRLVGATPRQVTGLAVVEALLSTITGALIGVVLFVLLRPVVALVPLDEATWFPEAISPPLVAAVALLVAVPVVGALAAAAALRRIVVTPLGVQRRTTPPPPGKLRLLPLVVSVAVLLGALAFGSSQLSDVLVLAVLGAAFAGIIGGIALAGPWLTAIVGRALHRAPRGAATLLASRRLTDDPRGSFGSIAGVVMAVFVASAFFTFAGYAGAQSVPIAGEMRPGHIVAELESTSALAEAELVDRLEAMPGVRSVVPAGGADVMVDGIDISQMLVETDGTSAVAERVRTDIAVEFPSSWVRRTEELATAEPIYTEFGRVVNLGVMGTMLLAGCSLAVAVTTWVLERRRQFAQLRSAGMPVSGLRKLVLLQAAAPLVCVAIFSAALGIGVTQAILILVRASVVPLPDASLALVLAASVLGALLMVGLMLPAIERLTRPDGLRME
ncbi:MAG: FtsX-like permease family protein [Chloroflexi bacterium]|nr:FtsX-like permease family protein [Chloroflexota bacterium]